VGPGQPVGVVIIEVPAGPSFLWRFLMNCRDDQCNSIPTAFLHSRRGIITALTSAALLPPPPLVAADASPDDERSTRIALDKARQADSSFGAVIVRNGQVLARGRNLRRTDGQRRRYTMPRRPWECRTPRQHALHFRGTLRHVDGRDSMVPHRPAWPLPPLCSNSPRHAIRS
jgi:hypothetical protein